jgi:glutamate racemase
MTSQPVGVFDSGVGGLSILRQIAGLLPSENLVYLADQANVPYGRRQLSEVRQLSEGIVHFLLAQGAKLIVVACNTASAAALHALRKSFPKVPFVGMEPAVKPAAKATKTKRVGVLATPATFQGELFESVRSRFAKGVDVAEITLPGLVERIEIGDLEGVETRNLLELALNSTHLADVDTVVLACTHYTFVIPVIQDFLGPAVSVIDPSSAIARQTERLLDQNGLKNGGKREGQVRQITTGEPETYNSVASFLLGENVHAEVAVWQDGDLHLAV